jgi:hypothetical protein
MSGALLGVLIVGALLLGASASAAVLFALQLRRERKAEGKLPPDYPVEDHYPDESPVDVAFRQLDADEDRPNDGVVNNVFPLAPRRAPPQEPRKESLMSRIQLPVENHSCQFLDGTRPAHMAAKDCSGTCRHNQQDGKICFWPSQTASQCGYYMPKVRMTAGPKA